MTRNEMLYIVGFLNELSDRFSNDGCNDMYLVDTPENREMCIEAEKFSYGEVYTQPYDSQKSKGEFCVNNNLVIDFLCNKLMKEFHIKKEDVPNV